MRRFTATGYLTWERGVFLHRHPKIKLWLPPGGHIEVNEDPVEAVIREIKEETGLLAAISEAPTSKQLNFAYPKSIMPPRLILEEDIDDPIDGFHNHIDMIYYCRIIGNVQQLQNGWHWVNNKQLAGGVALEYQLNKTAVPPQDVRILGQHAIKFVSTGDFFVNLRVVAPVVLVFYDVNIST